MYYVRDHDLWITLDNYHYMVYNTNVSCKASRNLLLEGLERDPLCFYAVISLFQQIRLRILLISNITSPLLVSSFNSADTLPDVANKMTFLLSLINTNKFLLFLRLCRLNTVLPRDIRRWHQSKRFPTPSRPS